MMPDGWSKKKFNAIVSIANGQVDPRVEPYASMIHIGPNNIVPNTGQLVGLKKCSELGLISGKYEFDEKSVVYSKIRPNLNKACRPDFRGVCSADMYPIWAKDGLSIDYLIHYILGPDFYKTAVSMSMRTGMPKINRSDLNAISMLVPPIAEQEKIARILSTWDRAISVLEKFIANSEQQKRSLMQKIITGNERFREFTDKWRWYALSDIAIVQMGSSPKSGAYNEDGYGLPLIQGNADIKNRRSAPRIFTAEITKECDVGDILLSVRAPVGTVALSSHKACIGRGISAIRTTMGFSQDFLYQWFLWFEPRWGALSQGSTFESINSEDIKQLKIKLPSLDEQKKIALILSSADQEIELLQQKLNHLKQEKKALMQQLLTGKRRVKVEAA